MKAQCQLLVFSEDIHRDDVDHVGRATVESVAGGDWQQTPRSKGSMMAAAFRWACFGLRWHCATCQWPTHPKSIGSLTWWRWRASGENRDEVVTVYTVYHRCDSTALVVEDTRPKQRCLRVRQAPSKSSSSSEPLIQRDNENAGRHNQAKDNGTLQTRWLRAPRGGGHARPPARRCDDRIGCVWKSSPIL